MGKKHKNLMGFCCFHNESLNTIQYIRMSIVNGMNFKHFMNNFISFFFQYCKIDFIGRRLHFAPYFAHIARNACLVIKQLVHNEKLLKILQVLLLNSQFHCLRPCPDTQYIYVCFIVQLFSEQPSAQWQTDLPNPFAVQWA